MRVTMYLLREEADLAPGSLRHPELYEELPLRIPDTGNAQWRLFTYPGEEREARWMAHVRPLLADPGVGEPLRNRAAGAVLLLGSNGRVFAITFGTGFHAINPQLIEHDFGLRVAANSVEPTRLKIASARGLGKGHRNAVSYLPTPNEIFALGLLPDEEWIQRFGGEARLPAFAKSINGADSLQVSIEDFQLTDLPAKLSEALTLFESHTYRETFPFLDYFRRETDKATIQELDERIADHIRQRDPDIGFALPDQFNLSAGSYRLSRRRRARVLPELSAPEVYKAIGDLNGWSDPLNQVKVEPYDLADQLIGPKQNLRSYTVATTPRNIDGQRQEYALTADIWFRVDQQYVDLVDRYIRDNVVDMTDSLRLPSWDDTFLKENVEGRYAELRYNTWVSQKCGYVLLDTELYRGKAGEHVEICDLLTRDKKLICVKRMDGSDKMSHLFQQGSVSAQLLLGNDDYQARVMNELHKLDADSTFGTAAEWTVVYAIATSKPGDLKNIMYFFSRAALKMHSESIKGRGFKVAIAKITRTAP
jgi:uncharacterized protein (TIGR04141 family)